MEKIEVQEIIDACEEAQSDYIKLYRPLLGYEDEVVLYRGIDDSMEKILNEIEEKAGVAFPSDLIEIYLMSNGGKYFDVHLYPLTTDKKDENGLYYKNMTENLKEEYSIPDNVLIIGETDDNEYILTGIDEEGYYFYCSWDKEEKKMNVDFDYLVELLVCEIDFHTNAFELQYSEEDLQE